MKTAELVPLALIAGAVVNVNGCRLRGRENNAGLDTTQMGNRVNNKMTSVWAGEELLVEDMGPIKQVLTKQNKLLKKERLMNAREEKHPKKESPDEARRHGKAAKQLAEACAKEMTSFNCKIGFRPADCLRNHGPKSFTCKAALRSW